MVATCARGRAAGIGHGWTAKAEENEMNTGELQRILGYLNIGLAIAHDSGVSIGHFGSGDFIQLAQTVNGMLLRSIAPAAGVVAIAAPVTAVTSSVANAGGPS